MRESPMRLSFYEEESLLSDSLPLSNGAVKIMFSIVSVCLSVSRSVHGGKDFTIQGSDPSPPPAQGTGPLCTGSQPPPSVQGPIAAECSNVFNLDFHPPPTCVQTYHYEAWTVGKRAVGIRLKCLLVLFPFILTHYRCFVFADDIFLQGITLF